MLKILSVTNTLIIKFSCSDVQQFEPFWDTLTFTSVAALIMPQVYEDDIRIFSIRNLLCHFSLGKTWSVIIIFWEVLVLPMLMVWCVCPGRKDNYSQSGFRAGGSKVVQSGQLFQFCTTENTSPPLQRCSHPLFWSFFQPPSLLTLALDIVISILRYGRFSYSPLKSFSPYWHRPS